MGLLLLWAACAGAGFLFAFEEHIPAGMAAKALPAFFLEAAFFYALAIDRIRARIEKMPPAAIAMGLIGAAIAPYLAASLAFGSFRWQALAWIAGLSAAASFWYVVLPHHPGSDVLFLVLMAMVWLSKVIPPLYVSPHPKMQLQALGQLMWFRTGIFAMVAIRRPQGVGFGFWPRKQEWKVGAVYYLVFLPAAVVLAWWIGFATPRIRYPDPARTTFFAIATFFGALWVLALGEEFLFRGLLQQWMVGWLKSVWGGILATSVLFGAMHLWFHRFPNWRIAAMATLLGVVCGLGFRQTRSIRAPMVTHALVVTTWRIFFS